MKYAYGHFDHEIEYNGLSKLSFFDLLIVMPSIGLNGYEFNLSTGVLTGIHGSSKTYFRRNTRYHKRLIEEFKKWRDIKLVNARFNSKSRPDALWLNCLRTHSDFEIRGWLIGLHNWLKASL